ncbi:MAG TPA: tetratricopeptide repeat protein, partial [Pyrinomonadaceae bacterium]|nr:tetratricopeptide repeat protein [Pyrinomonadaceae bacterium]
EGISVRVMKAAIVLLVSLFVVLGVAAGKRKLRPAARDLSPQPASCRLVLAPLTVDKLIDQEIARQQALILNGSTSNLERLGWTFVKKARLSFDAGFYKLAEQCAACMEARGASGPDALWLRAHALQSLHHFAEAESAARELVTLRERPFDYGVLGDVLIDQGKVREGAAAYQKMVDLRPDLQSYARAAHVRWLTGDLDGALELMKLATAASSPNDPEAAAWAFTRLALYQLQHGATKQALESCDAGLSLQSDYAPAMLARGRTLLAMNRAGEALIELQRAAKLNPLPEYQWALEDVLNVKSQISDTEDPRTLSLCLATRHQDVERAVKLAEQELANRGDVFTHDALAWALAAAGRTTEAQQHINQALSEGTADARLYLHAGVIAALNNDHKQARRWLQEAAAIKQMLLPSERAQLDAWRERVRQKPKE